MHMMLATVCALRLEERGVLVPKRFLCACCGFPECPMMIQIRLPLLNGPSWRPLVTPRADQALLPFLLRTSWIRHVHGGRSLQYNAVFCGAHVGPDAAGGHHRFVVIGSTTTMCIGAGAYVSFLMLSG